MTTDIFIVTFRRDFKYLQYCLKSIEKFATGFRVVVLVPGEDFEEAVLLARLCPNVQIAIRTGDEWIGKGFLWHMAQIMHAPQFCPKADFILHMDPDCIFTEPVTPEDYFVNGKPVLMYASYDWLVPQQMNLLNWKVACQNALGFEVKNEFMRRHPAVHYRKVYQAAQQAIEEHHRCPMDEYIQKQKNSFPQSFAEYPTLGAVAWKFFRKDYHWINQETHEFPPSKLKQLWSHREPTPEDMALFKQIGIA